MSTQKSPWIYVAGPIAGGDVVLNVRDAIRAGLRLRAAGACPIIPHLFHLAHLVSPQPYEVWTAWDLELLDRCDALIRLPGTSPGADAEVARALERHIPCFTSLAEALAWVERTL